MDNIKLSGAARKVFFLRHCGLDPQSQMPKRVKDAGHLPGSAWSSPA